MIHAYDRSYLNRFSRALGFMFQQAIIEEGMESEIFVHRFLTSIIPHEIETGNPKYLAGMSGTEMYYEIMIEHGYLLASDINNQSVVSGYSDVFWAGWILAQYQWYSQKRFKDILSVVSFSKLIQMYYPLHEADPSKAIAELDIIMNQQDSKLKTQRVLRGITQEELASKSGVSINTIRSYEQKTKDIMKAKVEIVLDLAKVLKCSIYDIL